MQVFLCAITPVFDGCSTAYQCLVNAIKAQTCGNFISVAVSNGPSPAIKEIVGNLNDPRFVYIEPFNEETKGRNALATNVSKRRNYCLKNFEADRYVFLDADLEIVNNQYFEKLQATHNSADILLTKIKIGGASVFPKHPVTLGRIDISNYSFSNKIAKLFEYPTDIDPRYGVANDYRFYKAISERHTSISIDLVSGILAGNKTYKRISEMDQCG